MEKIQKVSLLVFMLVLVLVVPVQADTTKWQINWDQDLTIVETVSTADEGLVDNLLAAGFTQNGPKNTYNRKIQDWTTYNELPAKFPILAQTKDFIIFSTTTFYTDKNLDTNILHNFNQALDFELITLGIYYKNSGEKIADSTYSWQLGSDWLDNLPKAYLTKCLTFNGLAVGLLLFLISALCIGILYVKKVRQTDQLIIEEYSIENYLANQGKTEKKKGKTDDEKWNYWN